MQRLNDKLESWLRTQGYPFEMVVARELKSARFRVVQAEYYEDPVTGKQRELDVYAWNAVSLDDFSVHIGWVVECKTSHDKPWVLFSADGWGVADWVYVNRRPASPLGLRLLEQISKRNDYQDAPAFRSLKRTPYSIVQALRQPKQGEDIAYNTVSAVSQAAAATVKWLSGPLASGKECCGVVFPVVLLDGQLFECFLDTNGEPILEEVDSGVLLWRNPLSGHRYSIVQIYTRDSISKFVKEAAEMRGYLLETCRSELENLARRLRKPETD